jgi:glycosyltransferase involved in cell wall biosynthesis
VAIQQILMLKADVMSIQQGGWIACQIGARENYAVPRIFRSYDILQSLITDIWSPAYMQAVLSRFEAGRRLRDRFHGDLGDADVRHFSLKFAIYGTLSQLRCEKWEHIHRANRLFAESAGEQIVKIARRNEIKGVFAYSYAALKTFQVAKRLKLATILGQIDAGPYAEELYEKAYGQVGAAWARRSRPPKAYWESWRRECELADLIVVNSKWSARALQTVGISSDKIKIVPVAFERIDFGARREDYTSLIPAKFSTDEPLKVIFVGSVSIEKGIHYLFQAAHRLKTEPVLFQIVGPINLAARLLRSAPANIHFLGPVNRKTVIKYLECAHLLLFPTLSDGFGIIQLEAHACGLPVVSTANCGEVVVDGQTGIVIRHLNAETICDIIRCMVQRPDVLVEMSGRASDRVREFNMARIGGMWSQAIVGIQSRKRLSR